MVDEDEEMSMSTNSAKLITATCIWSDVATEMVQGHEQTDREHHPEHGGGWEPLIYFSFVDGPQILL